MSDEIALLDAIAAHPEEDTPRLIYADWLDEHGQYIRAEFIRVQIAIAQKEGLPRAELNQYVDLYKRNQELIDNHRAELLGPLAVLPREGVEFHRGFASELSMPVDTFLAHAALFPTLRPLPNVRVNSLLRQLASFLACPHTGYVNALSGYAEEINDDELRYPSDSDLIDSIERLTRLEVLDLEGCGINDLHCDLAYNFSVPSLRDLDLSNNLITDQGVFDFLSTDLPQQLARLILGGNTITDDGAIELASRWPTGDADRLEHLNLRVTGIGQAGQRALLNRFGGRVVLF